MKSLKVVELRYLAVIYAEDGLHEHDARELASSITKHSDPDAVECLGVGLLDTFHQDSTPFSLHFCHLSIGEMRQRRLVPANFEMEHVS